VNSGYHADYSNSQGNKMQNLVGVLGGIIAVWLFFRGFAELGIRLSDLHPALRQRRKKYQALCRNPLYNIESPLEMTALLLVAAGNSGKPGTETRQATLRLFQDKFHLSNKDASALLISSTWLLQDGMELRNNLQSVMQRSLRNFTREQQASALAMIEHITSLDKTGNPVPVELASKLKELLKP
jgi:hypothetical protein